MRLELAPMEGITTYIYRNAANKYFGGIDTFFSPFISVHENKNLNFKERNDIKPDNNEGIVLIPQVMASDVKEFLHTVREITEMGYEHINFNFGCPSGTVTAKGKGAGALIYPEKLEAFLDEVFSKTNLKFSVKTRIGYSDIEEWEKLLGIYSRFPLEELIIHGRVREEFYNGKSRMEFVGRSIADLCGRMKISYNGDINSVSDYMKLKEMIPGLDACMVGRGFISNPALAHNIRLAEENSSLPEYSIDIEKFKQFNLEIMHDYEGIMSGSKNCLFRLKELWFYMSNLFVEQHKTLKKMQKCKNLKEYEVLINSLSQEEITHFW